jgi:hypothetical protein
MVAQSRLLLNSQHRTAYFIENATAVAYVGAAVVVYSFITNSPLLNHKLQSICIHENSRELKLASNNFKC